jgi:hypothetical protein
MEPLHSLFNHFAAWLPTIGANEPRPSRVLLVFSVLCALADSVLQQCSLLHWEGMLLTPLIRNPHLGYAYREANTLAILRR